MEDYRVKAKQSSCLDLNFLPGSDWIRTTKAESCVPQGVIGGRVR